MTDDEETEFYRKLYHGTFWSRMFGWLTNWDVEGVIYGFLALLTIFGFLAFAWGALMPSNTETKRNALRILRAHGYTHIQLSEVALFSCGHTDVNSESVTFSALSPAGMRMEGDVCCGWLKDCVIRFKYQDYDEQ